MVACVVSAHACVVWSHALTARRRMIVLRGRRACLLAGEYNRWDGYMDRRGGRPGRTGIRGAIVPGAGPGLSLSQTVVMEAVCHASSNQLRFIFRTGRTDEAVANVDGLKP